MTPEARRAELVAHLRASGELDDGWGEAFALVPRHLFIPDTIWLVDHDAGRRLRPLFHNDDPDRWLRCAYQDCPVDIQVDDGHPAADGTGYEVTSSASQPSVVAGMLRALAPNPECGCWRSVPVPDETRRYWPTGSARRTSCPSR